jgi:hypothetical protein
MSIHPPLPQQRHFLAREVCRLFDGFYPLDNDLQIERLGDGQNLRQNSRCDGIGSDGLRKCLVDLGWLSKRLGEQEKV